MTPPLSPPRPDIPGIADPLGLIANAVPFGILIGTLVVTVAVFIVTLLRDATLSPGPALQSSPAFYVLMAGLLLGVLSAATGTWVALAPVDNVYRRAMLSTVSGFATVIAMLATTPAYAALGRLGLAVLAAVCLGGIVWFAGRLRRIRSAP